MDESWAAWHRRRCDRLRKAGVAMTEAEEARDREAVQEILDGVTPLVISGGRLATNPDGSLRRDKWELWGWWDGQQFVPNYEDALAYRDYDQAEEVIRRLKEQGLTGAVAFVPKGRPPKPKPGKRKPKPHRERRYAEMSDEERELYVRFHADQHGYILRQFEGHAQPLGPFGRRP